MAERNRLRNIKVAVWLSKDEDEKLNQLSKKTNLAKSTVLRCLIAEYTPKEYPKDEAEKYIEVIVDLRNIMRYAFASSKDIDKEVFYNALKTLKTLETDMKNAFYHADKFNVSDYLGL